MKEYSAYCRYNPDYVMSFYPRHAFSARKQWIDSNGDVNLFETPLKNLLEYSLKMSLNSNNNPFVKVINPQFVDESPKPEKKKYVNPGKILTKKMIKTPNCFTPDALKENSKIVQQDTDFIKSLTVYLLYYLEKYRYLSKK